MKVNYIKLAWRNLWRNKRRTVITTASVLFAVFFALFMRSFQLGFYDHMIKNAIENFSGFIQVQHEDFMDDPSMNNVFEYNDEFIGKLKSTDGIKAVVPRVEGGIMGSSGNKTKVVLVMGIDPVEERKLSNPEHFIVKYRFSKEVLATLNLNTSIPTDVRERLHFLENRSYTSLGSLAVDMDIDPEKNSKYLQIIGESGKVVRYWLTDKVIAQLKEDPSIPQAIKDSLNFKRDTAFSNLKHIAEALHIDRQQHKVALDRIAELSEVTGEALVQGDDGVLIADNLAKFLNLDLGDTLITYGYGFQDYTAEGTFRVKGFIKLPNPDLNNKLVYMDIEKAQKMFMLDIDGKKRITTLAINLDNNSEKNLHAFEEKIAGMLNDSSTLVRNWMDFNPILQQQIESDNKSGQIFMGLLYFIIFFGILGTVMMMIHERKREFGVLIAVGMQRTRIAITFIYEMILMGLLGVFSGILVSLPFLHYFHNHPVRLRGDLEQMMYDYGFEPVMPLMWIDTYMLWQAIIVAMMVVMSCIYPLRKVYKLKAIDAIRS
ncbi:MAG: ABC transporter permease [Bacteroidales bacterium]|nr:ABC transporter permease [Bacteroidales bacterium]